MYCIYNISKMLYIDTMLVIDVQYQQDIVYIYIYTQY